MFIKNSTAQEFDTTEASFIFYYSAHKKFIFFLTFDVSRFTSFIPILNSSRDLLSPLLLPGNSRLPKQSIMPASLLQQKHSI